MDDDTLAQDLPVLLVELWGLEAPRLEPLGGGMNSATALVTTTGGDRFVAKWSADPVSLEAGCAAAARLEAADLRAGAPVATLSGASSASIAGGALALLRHVPGRELTGELPREQELMATTLARAHAAGEPRQEPWHDLFMARWLSPPDDVLGVAEWLGPELDSVKEGCASLPSLTWTQLHTDPAPEAFLHEERTGITGLIDWAGSCRGPALYDVASAVMYLGGPPQSTAFLASYAAHGPLMDDELEWLDFFRRVRWAIQASYFAGRLVADDQTGIADDPHHNREALVRAGRGLAETRSPTRVRSNP